MEVDRQARLANQDRLRRLALDKGGEVRLFCAHDPVEFERMQSAAAHGAHHLAFARSQPS
jgi:hypothetical protein